MKKYQLILALVLGTGMLGTLNAQAVISFVEQTSLMPSAQLSSGNAIGVCDMNGDRKDDIVRPVNNQTQYVEYQNAANTTFTEAFYSNFIGDPWGMCAGDMNNDGFNDVMWGDYGNTIVLKRNGTTYTDENITGTTVAPFIFVQGCNFSDINNDAFVDAFVCNDVALSHIYMNNGGTSWSFNNSNEMPLATTPASDNSGNYASIWCDVNNDGWMDLMITHCRQGVNNSADPRRIDQVFINNGNGTYTQDVTNWTGLRDGAQGWSTAWGDVDNDGDQDAFVLNYDVNSKFMFNNGSGVFTNHMSGSGIPATTSFFGENATFHDFDNDGFLDLMISGSDHFLYHNNGDSTFTSIANPFPYVGHSITAHAVGDLNGDGFLDLFASYCDIYNTPSSHSDKIWMNSTNNGNHYVFFDLVGGATSGMSNKSGIGAIVKIYGAWGVQVREVRSGEAYGIQNSFAMHFGLGTATSIDSAVVIWPSGIVDVVYNPSVDAHVLVNEGGFPTSVAAALQFHPVQMIVGPNPMTEQTSITVLNYAGYGLETLSLNIYDINGKAVYSQSALTNNIVYIDRSVLSDGMYFVELSNGETRLASEKLLVQ
jgi:hypothetical protein